MTSFKLLGDQNHKLSFTATATLRDKFTNTKVQKMKTHVQDSIIFILAITLILALVNSDPL